MDWNISYQFIQKLARGRLTYPSTDVTNAVPRNYIIIKKLVSYILEEIFVKATLSLLMKTMVTDRLNWIQDLSCFLVSGIIVYWHQPLEVQKRNTTNEVGQNIGFTDFTLGFSGWKIPQKIYANTSAARIS